MHELVLVLSDFYLSQDSSDGEFPAGVTLPGLQHVTRFATRSRIPDGWRPWLSRWLTGAEGRPAATVAAAALPDLPETSSVAWVATPMHWVAGMTSVHVDRRSLLRLEAPEQEALAADFQRVFHDSGFRLQPLEAGDFLMLGPDVPIAELAEPARAMGAGMVQQGGATPTLRKLGAEIEMWLHDHAINEARRRRSEQPITALWLWGGGPIAPASSAAATATSRGGGNVDCRLASAASGSSGSDIAFGRDSYLQGLWATRGAKVSPLPQQLADLFSYPQARRAVLAIEIGLMLQSNPKWTFLEAFVAIDRRFIAPAVEALNAGRCDRLVVLANDFQMSLRASDRFKFWRRAPVGLSGLQ